MDAMITRPEINIRAFSALRNGSVTTIATVGVDGVDKYVPIFFHVPTVSDYTVMRIALDPSRSVGDPSHGSNIRTFRGVCGILSFFYRRVLALPPWPFTPCHLDIPPVCTGAGQPLPLQAAVYSR